MVKRLYHGLALVALINLFALIGFVGFLVASGRLDEERAQLIADVLRGEGREAEPAPVEPGDSPSVPQPSRAEIAETQAKKEFFRLIGERLESEIRQRQELNDSVQLEVLRRLEEIDRKNQRFVQERQAFQEQSQQEGFQQVLDMYSQMEPELAKDLLRGTTKDADVVRILMEMDPNRRRNIINACQDEADRLWIRRILDQVQKIDER